MGTSYRELFKLYDLIQSGEARSVEQYLAENSINVNEIVWCKNIGVLHLAVGIEPEEKSLQCTEILLKHGADPNLCNNDGITPVHIAAIWGRVDNLKLLMGCGGDPSLQDMDSQSAFDYAAKEQQWDVYDYLHNVVDDLDDSFSSPCAYSLELEKVLMTTDQMVAEYEPVDNHMPNPTTVRKSEMVREWCEKSSLVMNKLYPTILSETFILDTDGAPFRSINLNFTKNMTLDLTTADVTSKSFEETNNTFATCLSKPLSREVEITGIKQLNITSDDGISCPVNKSNENKQRLSVYENFSLPGSPNSITHRNYNNKSSLRRKKKHRHQSKENTDSDLQIVESEFSQSLFTEDCTHDLNQALEVSQNETNERLSSGSLSNSHTACLNNCRVNCKNKSCTCQAKQDTQVNQQMGQLMSELKQKLKIRDGKLTDTNKKGLGNTSNSHTLNNNKNIMSHELQSKDKVSNKLHSKDGYIHGENSHEIQRKGFSNKLLNTDISDINNTRRSSASSGVSSNYSGGSIVIANVEEVYKYEDKEEDVVLIEKRLLVSSVVLPVDDAPDSSPDQTIISVASSLPPSVEYDNGTLRAELIRLGFTPGPILDSTKTLYLKKLRALKRNPIVKTSQGKTYSIELEKSLRCEEWLKDLSPYIELENKARVDFSNPNKKWREGTTKTSFTYLLLDPRLTDNLPLKSSNQAGHVSWVTFVNSIFYVGKGKRSRPYSHLYQALELWKRNFTSSKDKKVQHILDIWSDKVGVVCLHIFQNVIPAEAYTYEAAMIDVLGLHNLTNLKSGNYYGAVASWPHKERRMLGLYLLYKAMRIFLSEGERQLRPEDID